MINSVRNITWQLFMNFTELHYEDNQSWWVETQNSLDIFNYLPVTYIYSNYFHIFLILVFLRNVIKGRSNMLSDD